jgi:hypothetical protein
MVSSLFDVSVLRLHWKGSVWEEKKKGWDRTSVGGAA